VKGRLTQIGPGRLEIRVIVIGESVGAREVQIQSSQTALQWSVDRLHEKEKIEE
jgi:hypothetical protein